MSRVQTCKHGVVSYFVEKSRVLLGERKQSSTNLGLGLYAGIGGKNKEGEASEEALKREVKEEIKVEILDYTYVGRIVFIFPHKPKWNLLTSVFTIQSWNGKPQETEEIKPQWFEKNNIPFDKMWEDNRFWLPRVLQGEKIDAVCVYEDDNVIQTLVIG